MSDPTARSDPRPYHPRILLSDLTAKELSAELQAIFGDEGYEHVTAKQIHDGTTDADICFVSREITGGSTKQNVLPGTQYFYDALRKSKTLQWVQVHSAGADRQTR